MKTGSGPSPRRRAYPFASAYGVTVDYIYFGKRENKNQLEGTQTLISRMVRRIPLVALENMSELKRIASGLEPTSVTVPVGSLELIPERGIFIEIKDKSMSNSRVLHLLRARR